ncbi:Zinc finger BED domain-containing protein 5, partial [Stegodyphus mimosarum]
MFGDKFSKQLQSIPLSNDTVARRIGDKAEDVQCQLFSNLRNKLFSIQLDEATDSNKDTHFIIYVRFCCNMSVVEELRFCKPTELKATALAIFAILNDFMNEANIEWKNCVGICTDGARSMSGRFQIMAARRRRRYLNPEETVQLLQDLSENESDVEEHTIDDEWMNGLRTSTKR